MISIQMAQSLNIGQEIPPVLQRPQFCEKQLLWFKETKHKSIVPNNPRYEYTKIGRTLGFETTRYLTLQDKHLFYFDSLSDKDYKGYCNIQNVYLAWHQLKNKKYILYLTNGSQNSLFYFTSSQFYEQNIQKLAKYAIQLDFKQKFQVLDQIGKGSFSKVYKVQNILNKKFYAAKMIGKKDKNKSNTKSIVIQQKKILSQINSKYVYKFEAFYQQENHYIIILEYLNGKDLMSLFKQKHHFTMQQKKQLLKKILIGLKDCHDSNIIHRDLKPQNIFINLDNLNPKIIDFGLSLMIEQKIELKNFKRCGTMGYMAPQVIANSSDHKKPYTAKCDLFSYGIICHMIILGFNPLKGSSYQETYSKNKLCQIQLDQQSMQAEFGSNTYIFFVKLLAKNPNFRNSAEAALKSLFFSEPLSKQIQQSQTQSQYRQNYKH